MDKGFFYCRFFYCRVFPVWKMRINGAFMQGSLNDEFFWDQTTQMLAILRDFPYIIMTPVMVGGFMYT